MALYISLVTWVIAWINAWTKAEKVEYFINPYAAGG